MLECVTYLLSNGCKQIELKSTHLYFNYNLHCQLNQLNFRHILSDTDTKTIKYHCHYNSSIIMVSSRYGSGSFLIVWYRHGTDSGNFHKTFDVKN